jgi:uncharacterized membrane protein YhaH (DUF805 family)
MSASFTVSIKNAFVKAFDFKTRSSRAEFWYFYLFTVIVGTFGNLIDQYLSLELTRFEFSNSPNNEFILGHFYTFTYFLFFVPSLSLYVRRLHDTNRSGFWLLLVFLPSVGAIFGLNMSGVIYLFIFVFITLIFFLCQKGDDTQNKFGNPIV